MFTDEPAPFAHRNIHVDPLAVDVVHENLALVFFRPHVALVNEQARVRVAATHRITAAIGGMRTFGAGVMDMVTVRLDIRVGVGKDGFVRLQIAIALIAGGLFKVDAVMFASLPQIASALDHMPEMRNDTSLNKTLPVLIEVDAPGIACAFSEDLELVLNGMIAPHR